MIRTAALALLMAAAPASAEEPYDPALDSKRYDGCVRAIPTDAKTAEDFALQWQARGGGPPGRPCQALAQLHQGRHAAAAITLSRAAQAAEAQRSPMVADFWGQAGNAALLAGDARGAVTYFSSAIVASGEFAPLRSANLLIDRARAHTDLNDLAAARADLDRALELAPNDATGWLLSATLARRQGDLQRAATDIGRAAALDGGNPDILLEQGNVAALSGDEAAARTHWEQAVKSGPGTPAADYARQALASN